MNVTGSFTGSYVSLPRKNSDSPLKGTRGVERGGGAHHLNADACIDIGGDPKCLFSGGCSNLSLMFLLASPAFPPQEPFDRLEIGQGSKFGEGQMMVSFLISSLQMDDMNELLT